MVLTAESAAVRERCGERQASDGHVRFQSACVHPLRKRSSASELGRTSFLGERGRGSLRSAARVFVSRAEPAGCRLLSRVDESGRVSASNGASGSPPHRGKGGRALGARRAMELLLRSRSLGWGNPCGRSLQNYWGPRERQCEMVYMVR